ncbi:hypothetical protein ABW19_dt0207720 [Dactylella cylindrospora]|nr:hypothetical protein ABW19_dt0207720 [Dactylella cylindrospora]
MESTTRSSSTISRSSSTKAEVSTSSRVRYTSTAAESEEVPTPTINKNAPVATFKVEVSPGQSDKDGFVYIAVPPILGKVAIIFELVPDDGYNRSAITTVTTKMTNWGSTETIALSTVLPVWPIPGPVKRGLSESVTSRPLTHKTPSSVSVAPAPPSTPPPSPPPPPPPTSTEVSTMQSCIGLDIPEPTAPNYLENDYSYFKRDLVAAAIEEICVPSLDHPSQPERMFSKEWYEGSPEHFSIEVRWAGDMPESNECRENLFHILDSCDANNPANPHNWKSGGLRIVGEDVYQITAKSRGRKPPNKAWAACFHLPLKQTNIKLYRIWAYGFSDAFRADPEVLNGEREDLYAALMNCGMDRVVFLDKPGPKSLDYPWEWRITGANKYGDDCLEQVIRDRSGIQDFKCTDENKERLIPEYNP